MSSRSLPFFNAVLSSEVGVAIEFDFLDRFQGRFAKFRATLQNLFVEVAAFLVHSSTSVGYLFTRVCLKGLFSDPCDLTSSSMNLLFLMTFNFFSVD